MKVNTSAVACNISRTRPYFNNLWVSAKPSHDRDTIDFRNKVGICCIIDNSDQLYDNGRMRLLK